jgi:SAM-dependent methyltransferase
MPDANWYEQMYGGRDTKLLPLEPGHKYFLGEPLAPKRGELLDIGCGTGNFLSAARDLGYEVTGIELDGNAAAFAKKKTGLQRVFPLSVLEFERQYPGKKFDFISFFEVLEHQAEPKEFLGHVRSCLRPGGYIALSVPNRERWLTGPDVLDYPPNHFLRWNVGSLNKFLDVHGFEILTVQEQSAGVAHIAQMINMSLRTGLTRPVAGELSTSFRDVMQMDPEIASAVLQAKPSLRLGMLQALGRIKAAACYPVALLLYPFVLMRGLKGTYLYCFAREKN